MEKPKVMILGASGMLGAITLDSFAKSKDFQLFATVRDTAKLAKFKSAYPDVQFKVLDAEKAGLEELEGALKGVEWVVNAIGIIKPYIHDDNPDETERAIRVNALFPELLAKASKKVAAQVLQIATDCVYSGQKGGYVEDDAQDALDVYGKTKSLGESHQDTMYHLRCSIIGPELAGHLSLLDWFLGQPKGAEVNGFTNHQWNGVTTLQFAKLCQGIIKSELVLPHVQHIIPGNLISKADLLRAFAKSFGRNDIKINDVEAPKVIDRTLSTKDKDLNDIIWKSAGYSKLPTIEEMIQEAADYGQPSEVPIA